jgi:hypothetical protein
MSLIGLLLLLVIVGVALYLIPMEPRIKTIIGVVVALAVCLWLFDYFGLVHLTGVHHRNL